MRAIVIPFDIGQACKLKKIPNFLKKHACLDDIFQVGGVTVYITSKGTNILYNLTNVKNNTHIYCSSDILKD